MTSNHFGGAVTLTAAMLLVGHGSLMLAQSPGPFPKRVTIEGRYQTSDYGFSIRIPKRLLAFVYCDSQGICGGAHGFEGVVAGDEMAKLYVYSEYSPAAGNPPRLAKSNAALMQYVLDGARPKSSAISILESSDSKLGALSAIRVLAQFVPPNVRARHTIEIIFGLRVVCPTETILYRIGITAPDEDYQKSRSVFAALVRSFRTEPLEGPK
jgi:hypothetical protein